MRRNSLVSGLFICFVLLIINQKNYAQAGKNLNPDSTINALISHISSDSIESNMRSLEEYGNRFYIGPNHREQAMWIKEKYESYGFENVEIDSFPLNLFDTATWHYNIIATIEGSINPDQVVVLGGHWDSVNWDDVFGESPGADDNASGTVAAMEIARAMKETGYQPELSIKFMAFDAEEVGLLGSAHYAANAVVQNMDIVLMINNDMISNSGDDNWRINVSPYDNSDWAYKLAIDFVSEYTTITPTTGYMNSGGSDSYSFWDNGFPAVFFHEYEFSPNYHSPTDIVDSSNIEYCTEAVKASCALLTYITLVPYHPEQLYIEQLGDGSSLIARWKLVFNADVSGYNIYLYDSGNNLEDSFFTSDTSFLLTNLTEGETYKIGVATMDSSGNESVVMYKEKTAFSVSFDQGIAIIDESYGGILDPTDEDIDNFYEILLHNYEHTKIDILDKEQISLSELGKYSTIIWHHNKLMYNTSIYDSREMLADYLLLGGNLLLTSDRLTFAINEGGSYNNYNVFNDGDFIKDYLKIDSSYIKTIGLFKGATANYENLPNLDLDTTKTSADNNYHLMLTVEAIFPGRDAKSIYLYDTEYEQNTNQGVMKDMPVGVIYENDIYNAVSLGFPLYYMNLAQSKVFTDYILQDVFGELTNSAANNPYQYSEINIWPNPATDVLNVNVADGIIANYSISIFDVTGTKLKSLHNISSNIFQINISDLNKGIYFVKFEISSGTFLKKFIK